MATQSAPGPRVTVLLPVFRPPLRFLRLAIASVRQQTWPDWQLVLVDDAGGDPEVTAELRQAAADPRVKLIELEVNQGIAGASNAGLAAATGAWLALLDHDDVLEPDALASLLTALDAQPTAEMGYSDRDTIDAAGIAYETFAKPDWSPERLRANMYLAHLTMLRTAAVREVGGFRTEFSGAQDHDLALRIAERGAPVVHVPRVLYHWRALPSSTAADAAAKPYAAEAGLAAVTAHLDRTGYRATVAHSPHPGTYLIARTPRPELVSLVIPTRGGHRKVRGQDRVLVLDAVAGILAHDYEVPYEVVIVADQGGDRSYLGRLAGLLGERLQVVEFAGEFNFSAKINAGVAAAHGEVVVLLNDDVEVISVRWLDQLVALAQYPDVGAVGAKLLFADGKVQHAGHFYRDGAVGHIDLKLKERPGPFAANVMDREVVGVTAACLAQRREVWERVGGMDQTLPNNFNDVDYCWRIRTAGYRIVQANSVRLFHFESQTRVAKVADWEARRIVARLGDQLHHDPFTPNPAQGRTLAEALRVSHKVIRDEGFAAFGAKARKKLAKQ
ncbi:MAG: glycosyltransferase family 2 protein [Candidatus Nanopelagicales bacterium]